MDEFVVFNVVEYIFVKFNAVEYIYGMIFAPQVSNCMLSAAMFYYDAYVCYLYSLCYVN